MSAGTTSIRRPAAHDRVYVVDGAYHQTFGPREASTGDNHHLHASLMPLRVADLRSDHERAVDAGQGALFDPDALSMDCTAGVCFT